MTTAPGNVPLRIRVVLVHHQDQARVAAVRDTVHAVADALSPYGDVEVTEVSRQPPLLVIPPAALAGRRVRQWRLERRWAKHLGVDRRWVLSSGLLALRLLQIASGGHRARAGRQAFIELALSAKHQLAWRQAAEDAVDVLVVLEDDARVHSETHARLKEVLAVATPRLTTTYADLAGGLSSQQLRIDEVATRVSDGVVELKRPATNTTCAYLVGAEVVNALVDRVTVDPTLGRLPADWLMNSTFMAANVRCLHTSPAALDHGSFTGAVASSIRP